MPFVVPEIAKKSFTCPNCGVLSIFTYAGVNKQGSSIGANKDTAISWGVCANCDDITVWKLGKQIYPMQGASPPPNESMPNDVKVDYQEAAAIYSISPKGAAALLRLSIQKLCIELGQPGKNLNTEIANLVKEGLPERIQQALDIVRVIGNESVHPGQIATDDPKTVEQLFYLVNEITDYMIAKPIRTQQLFDSLPQSKKKAIEDRDA